MDVHPPSIISRKSGIYSRSSPEDSKAVLLGLEATIVEMQSATVLSDCPHDLLRRTVRYVGLYFQSQPYVRSL